MVWLSLLLIVILETLLVAATAVTGDLHGPTPFLVDLVEKVPWALFVCAGVWIGLAAGGGRLPLSLLAGLVAAPIGSLLLRAVAEGAHAMAFAAAPLGPSPFAVAAVKGLEYGCLGVVIGWLGRRSWAAVHHHAAAGLSAGIVFGGVLLAMTAAASDHGLDSAKIATWVVNELLFPIGCALILFSAARAEATALSSG